MARVMKVIKYCYTGTLRRQDQYCLLVQEKTRGYGSSSSSNNERVLEVEVGGRQLKFSSGKYAKLADGAVIAQLDNTSVLVTAVSERDPKEGASGTPLIVDYRERASAAGRIPYNFFRRELRPMEREILTSRLIDRSLRPLFPEGYAYNTQIICSLLSIDGHQDQEIISINGACAALMLSDIPWNGPIAAVRVIANQNGEFLVNPTKKEAVNSDLNIILACTKDKIVMVEGYGNEVAEEDFCRAVRVGMGEAQNLLQSLANLRRHEARKVQLRVPSEELTTAATEYCSEKIMDIFTDSSHKKLSRDNQLFALRDGLALHLKDKTIPFPLINQIFWNTAKRCMETLILDKGTRCDGRGMHELRQIECEVDMFELLHGSSRFLRGETQVLSTVTLDSPEHAAKADEISLLIGAERSRNFMVHYDFPPFANNRTGHFMMAGRREVGHGALAERAIKPLLPRDFPFTIRVASQVTDSNGSSSMATVCGSSLALFDAGVPMSKSAAGVACGLILDSKSGSSDNPRYQLLSDISGIEDALGYMDFKMAGTREGITSCQVDVKGCTGLSYELFEEAVRCSRESRLKVLDIMDECQSSPRPLLKENGPVHEIITVPTFKRNKVIGMGGHKIRPLIEETGVRLRTVGTEEMSIFAPSRTILEDVKEKIFRMMNEEEDELEVGSVYNARIADIRPYGFMINLLPMNLTVLLHSSQLSHAPNTFPLKLGYKIGDEIEVKYEGKDEETGRLQVSRKALLEDPSPIDENKEAELKVGEVYKSRIFDVRHYGLMVELVPSGTKVLLHSSNIAHGGFVDPSQAGYKVGDEIEVKYLGKDAKTGKKLISRKVLLDPPPPPPKKDPKEAELTVGQVYSCRVREVRVYGLVVELLPSKIKTLLHASRIDHYLVNPLKMGYKVGDEMKVKYLGVEPGTGKKVISRKVLLDPSTKDADINLVRGNIYDAKILEVKSFGYKVELVAGRPNTSSLLHASQIDKGYVDPIKHGYKVGDQISVKYLGRNKLTGRLEISRKALLTADKHQPEEESDDDSRQTKVVKSKRTTKDGNRRMLNTAADETTSRHRSTGQLVESRNTPVPSPQGRASEPVNSAVNNSGQHKTDKTRQDSNNTVVESEGPAKNELPHPPQSSSSDIRNGVGGAWGMLRSLRNTVVMAMRKRDEDTPTKPENNEQPNNKKPL